MTSSICHHFFLYSHGYGQYFPWPNFKKKDILVFSSLSSFRLGLSPYRLGEKGTPYSISIPIYFISISTCITLSILSLFLSPHLSLYLFYLYLHSPHLSLYPSFLYLHIYHFIYSFPTSITLSTLSPHLSLYLFYL